MTSSFVTNTPLRIAAIGMDERMRELMKMAFQGPGKGSCLLSSIENADVFLFNMDSIEGPNLWNKLHSTYPMKPAIMMSLKDPHINEAIFLEKPFRIEKLLEVLGSVKKRFSVESPESSKPGNSKEAQNGLTLKSYDSNDRTEGNEREFCGSNHDIDLANAASLANVAYKPSDYLQEQIFQASRLSKSENVAIQIAVKVNDKWELITFLPNLQGVFTTLSDFQLRVISTAPKYCTETKIHRYNAEETAILENGPKTKISIQARDPFLWKIALWTSRGRIPEGTSLSAPVKLVRWPNLTRLHTTPNCMRIATLLVDEARPLRVVAKVLNIPQRHVFAFFSASHALGLINSTVETKTTNEVAPAKKHKEHSLLSRILKRLTGTTSN